MSTNYDPFNPDSKDLIAQIQRLLKGRGRQVAIVGALVLIFFFGLSAFYQVEPDEVGVVLRFGKDTQRAAREAGEAPAYAKPGLHLKLPVIDQVIKVPVEAQLKMEFGFRTVQAGVQSEFSRDRRTNEEAKMLTADRNVATVEWIVQYKIADPAKYLFNFRAIQNTLRLMSEAEMRAVVGNYTVDELITGGREEIEDLARKRLQSLNDEYDTGIVIQQLKLQDANVPENVKPSLREVEEAKQERERAVNEAERARNSKIPEARGKAKQMIAEAEGYAIERTNEAEGDASRFKALHEEYRKAKQVTRTRLYFESLSEVLPRAQAKVLVDKDTQGLVPLLNMTAAGESVK